MAVRKLTTLITFGLLCLNAQADELSVSPESVDFGNSTIARCHTAKITITNGGNQSTGRFKIQVEPARIFALNNFFNSCKNGLQGGASCRLFVEFCPELVQKYQGSFEVNGKHRVELRGWGASPATRD